MTIDGGTDQDMANFSLALAASLESRLERLERENVSLRTALHHSGKSKLYIDGYEAAVKDAMGAHLHVSWAQGARPDPNECIKMGVKHVKDALVRSLEFLQNNESMYD